MESKKVVDVPRDRMASPGADRDITVAGLSPVKEAIIQSETMVSAHRSCEFERTVNTLIESPSLSPPRGDFAQKSSACDGLWS